MCGLGNTVEVSGRGMRYMVGRGRMNCTISGSECWGTCVCK